MQLREGTNYMLASNKYKIELRYTHADMKILQYIRRHIKNGITQIAHYNAFTF